MSGAVLADRARTGLARPSVAIGSGRLGVEARAFYGWLKSAHESARYPIPDNTFRYWTNAVG